MTQPRSTAVICIAPRRLWFGLDWSELWHYRELLLFLVWRDLKLRYKQTVMGVTWVILQPLLTTLVFTVFFGRLAHMPSGGVPYPLFYFAGLLPWLYFAGAVTAATNVIVQHQHTITKVYFPRLLLPLSSVISGLVDFGVSFLVLLGLAIYYRAHLGSVAVLPAALLLAVSCAFAVGLWLAALNALYRDVRYATPFVLQFWMFASPVAYPSWLVPARWRWLYELNPMAVVIDGFRQALTGSAEPPVAAWAGAGAIVAIILSGGLLYFQRMEDIVADVI
jgi:lipopolysaccharide transport system permease protein